ncbi:MAG: class I SAM-dependent methyltransferase [Methanoregula sp.]|nr:class I SAM-dependent methyltransferase [Methanoregula sp.]
MSTSPRSYVHGRSDRESERLHDQASGLGFLLNEGTSYPPGSTVLEAGCGVGAQTLLLAGNSPHAQFVSIDISPESLARFLGFIPPAGVANACHLCYLARKSCRETYPGILEPAQVYCSE